MSSLGEDTKSAILGFTGGRWGISRLCPQTLFRPPSQPCAGGSLSWCLCPSVQPKPPCLLTHLPTQGEAASSEPSSVCSVPRGVTEEKLRLGPSRPIAIWWQRWAFNSRTWSSDPRTSVFPPHQVPKQMAVTSHQSLGFQGPCLLPEGQHFPLRTMAELSPGLRSPCVCDCAQMCVCECEHIVCVQV